MVTLSLLAVLGVVLTAFAMLVGVYFTVVTKKHGFVKEWQLQHRNISFLEMWKAIVCSLLISVGSTGTELLAAKLQLNLLGMNELLYQAIGAMYSIQNFTIALFVILAFVKFFKKQKSRWGFTLFRRSFSVEL